jgi:hypothetical protein
MNAWLRRVLATLTLAAAATAIVLACGPFFSDLLTVSHHKPADLASYARGELGLVKPTFERRYLVQAYRRLGGATAIAPDARPPQPAGDDSSTRWNQLQTRELPAAVTQTLKAIRTDRVSPDYSSFLNCFDAAFERALTAYSERTAQYGARSPQLIDWLTGQAAVFQNCASGPLVLPLATTSDDPRLRADRDYQTAAAYFYATQYDEAAGRFRAIATNTASPWRPSGRYLAARALIRSVTVPPVPPKDAVQRLAAGRTRPPGDAGRQGSHGPTCLRARIAGLHRRPCAAHRQTARALGAARRGAICDTAGPRGLHVADGPGPWRNGGRHPATRSRRGDEGRRSHRLDCHHPETHPTGS